MIDSLNIKSFYFIKLFIILLLVLFFIRAILSCVSSYIYLKLKYGPWKEIMGYSKYIEMCELAFKLQKTNYYICELASSKAYQEWRKKSSISSTAKNQAEKWIKTGLKLNPFYANLHFLKVKLIEEDSPSDALYEWDKYLSWHFWYPLNHFIALKLAISAANTNRIIEEIKWLRNTEYASKIEDLIKTYNLKE